MSHESRGKGSQGNPIRPIRGYWRPYQGLLGRLSSPRPLALLACMRGCCLGTQGGPIPGPIRLLPHFLGGSVCGCPDIKSPATLGPVLGPLAVGNSHMALPGSSNVVPFLSFMFLSVVFLG